MLYILAGLCLVLQLDQSDLIYLTDDNNTAILPEDDMSFDMYRLTSGHHYKVISTAMNQTGPSVPSSVVSMPGITHTGHTTSYSTPLGLEHRVRNSSDSGRCGEFC